MNVDVGIKIVLTDANAGGVVSTDTVMMVLSDSTIV